MNKNHNVKVHEGIVKFYNENKGFGFIIIDNDEGEIFFHVSKIEGGKVLKTGQRVNFNIIESFKGRQATNVRTESDDVLY